MLRVLEKARPKCAIEISSTFCGAHSVPKGSTAAQVGSHQVYFYSKNTFLYPQGKHRTRVGSHYIDYNRLEGNLIHSGDHWCDRETTPSSFEAQKRRSVLTNDQPTWIIFKKPLSRPIGRGEYWCLLWKGRFWGWGLKKNTGGKSWHRARIYVFYVT